MAFVLPAELFPTRYRSSAYGVSAAFGKVGVILSCMIFEWIYNVGIIHYHTRFLVISIIFAVFMAVGAVCTTFLPETNNQPLEKIAEDDGYVSSNAKAFVN